MNVNIKQKHSKYAVFNYRSEDNCLVDELSSYLDAEAERIFKFFNVTIPKQKITINIIPTKEEFDSGFKARRNLSEAESVPPYVRGEYFERHGAIYYLSIADYKNTTHSFKESDYNLAVEDYKKTLLHEFVHYVNKMFNIQYDNGWTSKYLIEGIAIYLSGQKENLDIEFNFTLEDVLGNNFRNDNYNAFYLITKYFVENYEKEFVLDLFTSSNQSRRFLENELYYKAKDFYSGIQTLKG